MINSLFQLFTWAGSEWVLVLLGALSVTILALGLQRYFALVKVSAASKKFWSDFGNAWVEGNGQGTATWKDQLDAASPSLERAVLATVERNKTKPSADIERQVAATIEHRRISLERAVNVLGTIGANAAFVGLLGTVLGIIRAFDMISAGGVSSGIENISSGIAEALVATAVGIFVAIPAVVLFNYFNRRVGLLCRKAAVAGQVAVADLAKGH